MRKSLIALIAISLPAWGFNKDFTLINDRAPLEFKLLFESMKNSLKQNQDQLRLVVLAQHINTGLSPLKKDQAFFLLKSEIYKTLLEWPYPVTQFQVGTHTLERLRRNLELNQAIYTPFSAWVIEALIADLEIFNAQGLLNLTPSQRSVLSGEKAQQYLKMQRILKRSRGWLEQADTLSAADFNALTEQLAWRTMEHVKEKAMLFQRFSSKAVEDTQTNTFNIPDQGMPNQPAPPSSQPDTPSPGLAEQAAGEKREAEKTMEKIDTTGVTLPADELSGAIDKLDEQVAPGGTAPTPTPAPPVDQQLQ